MNERIKELALQAGLEMCSCGCDMPTRQSAKFAELLEKEFEAKHFSAGYIAGQSDGISETVRECAEVVYSRSGHATPQDLYEHFGVEE